METNETVCFNPLLLGAEIVRLTPGEPSLVRLAAAVCEDRLDFTVLAVNLQA